MKKLINSPKTLVRETLEGVADLSGDVALLDSENVLVAKVPADPAARKVAVLSGGGSGHEPAHAGYVGAGMLTAAIAGDVFTSPSVDAVLAAIRAVAGPAGALLIVKNYTGDRLNFGLAAEIATAEGIPTEIAVVADDVALHRTVAPERRRGIAGTVLVHKVAGAMAANGASLAQVAAAARHAASSLGTMGVALGACTVPAVGKPGFELAGHEIELGLGIHGEKGVERTSIGSADELVGKMLSVIAGDLELSPGQRIAVMVNGLGGTPPIELSVVTRAAIADLRWRGLLVERAWSGVFLSALEMPGMSLTVLKLDNGLAEALDAATTAPAWPGAGTIPAARSIIAVPQAVTDDAAPAGDGPLSEAMRQALAVVADALLGHEELFADLDSRAGDGDLGASMNRGATVLKGLPAGAYASPSHLLLTVAAELRRAIAGSSGPFYAIGLARAARVLTGIEQPGMEDWRRAFAAAVDAVEELGGAKPGDRTMVDALRPALDAWTGQGIVDAATALSIAADAAEQGAEATAGMKPGLGRAAYLGDRALGVRDGGAVVVAVWLRSLAEWLAGRG